MPKLYYQGHSSYRLTSDDGKVVFIDPYVGDGYELPADIILVTHGHHDHNQIDKCTQKPGCRVITHEDALIGGVYQTFDVSGVTIEAVMAGNLLHNPKKCVGYIITVDGVKLYASGDTSKTEQMVEFAARAIDYAVLCADGKFNMGLREAAECARLIGAKHNIVVHTKPGALFDRSKAEKWDAPNKLIVEPGQEVVLNR
ncbi:MAG: MBL fold metallo-hydrolase [Actinomycetes bacterium]|jgi:L-ascorbate metabolism protein UlaG (beta-lactamase superfamily)|nr:MBL fold metallo-hydrolase [Actinomycetes bacterium]